ncbi:MBL fold metallo-hydrolase [Cryobacterium fucosi]|uniref:MBL fold metallo-hydrolase n=1 Tax=Cryobacterium fucosi TaxID=1259157 RepID=A0A4R9B2K0_9MICO|nr:MBL fold metallo-hydrolase [Cryobacterium fucosi]TFD74588.1 MBL fold metallo-hydrolase [Cryobacterium fucosi]
MSAHIDHLVTSGSFSLDGGTWAVDNNVWIIGDDAECVVIDPAHDTDAILAAIGDRRLVGILCTHAHDDHIGAAMQVQAARNAPTHLHPDDMVLWDRVYPDAPPSRPLDDGQLIAIGGIDLQVLHTPGHSPGAVCFYAPALGTLFSGDTLFAGGPGATGRSFSDFPTIIESISTKLLTLPPETIVLTGHGERTTIGAEAAQLPDWIARGH